VTQNVTTGRRGNDCHNIERDGEGYQIRAKQQREKGESGQNWTRIILATILGLLATAGVSAGVSAFMFRKTIITGLLTATLGPRAA
jgi:hypothetical protein